MRTKKIGKDQPEPAVRRRLEGSVEPGALRRWFETATEGDLDRPPLCIVHPCGRSNATVSSSTYGLLLHFARHLVPGPTGPSVSLSITSHVRTKGQLLCEVVEVTAAGAWGPAPAASRWRRRTPS